MKHSILFVALFLVSVPQGASAKYIGPILESVQYSGFVPAGYDFVKNCKVFLDRVEIATKRGRIESSYSYKIQISGELFESIAEADLAKLEYSQGPVDVSSKSYYAVKILPNDAIRTVTLGRVDGGSGKVTKNNSAEAATLRNVIDDLCSR
ncbi:MAG: hypothetical protein IT289_07530 [Oligoflexia bacterium]|nr:hypothetical protein [Oligoflexia bacterium]